MGSSSIPVRIFELAWHAAPANALTKAKPRTNLAPALRRTMALVVAAVGDQVTKRRHARTFFGACARSRNGID
jgi:hypothetical protein